MGKKPHHFFSTGLWRIRSAELAPGYAFLLRQFRVFVLAVQEFSRDRCLLRASALTFYTLLSIVPVFAMIFGVAKGFGLEAKLDEYLRAQLQANPELTVLLDKVLTFSQNMLAEARGGLVAGAGIVILIWTVLRLLSNIERSFNDIWGVRRNRSFARKFSDYMAFMLISPIVLVISNSLTVLVTSQVETIIDRLALWGWVGPVFFLALKFLPWLMLWGLLTFSYLFMPNTRVSLPSGLLGGFIAGSLYIGVQWVYLHFQIALGQYNAIYGSFAALPFFLIWLQISWLIVLLGAEIAFAHDNVETYEFEPDSGHASPAFQNRLALALSWHCVQRFQKGEKPLTSHQLAQELQCPIRLVRMVLEDLKRAGVLAEVQGEDEKERAYQPAQDSHRLTMGLVLNRLQERGVDNIPLHGGPHIEALLKAYDAYREALLFREEDLLLKDIGEEEARKTALGENPPETS